MKLGLSLDERERGKKREGREKSEGKNTHGEPKVGQQLITSRDRKAQYL